MTDLLSRVERAAAGPESGASRTRKLRTRASRTSRRAEFAWGRRKRTWTQEGHACARPVADRAPRARRWNTNSARVARQSWRAELARERRADAFDCARHAGRTGRRGDRRAGAVRGLSFARVGSAARRPARKRRFACAPGRAGRAARRPARSVPCASALRRPDRGRRDDRRGNDDRRRGGALARSPHIAELAWTAGRPAGEA